MYVFSLNSKQNLEVDGENVHYYHLQASKHTLLKASAHSETLPHQPATHIRKLCKYGDWGCLELSAPEFLKCVLYKWRPNMKRYGGKREAKKNPEWAIHNQRQWGKPIFSTYKLCSLSSCGSITVNALQRETVCSGEWERERVRSCGKQVINRIKKLFISSQERYLQEKEDWM